MNVCPIADTDDCWKIAGHWREMSSRDPLLTPEWLLTWWKHYGGSNKLRVLHCTDREGKTIGVAPLYECSQFGHRRLEMLGAGSVCTDYVRFLSNPDDSETVLNATVANIRDYFRSHSMLKSTELVIEGVDTNSESIIQFAEVLANHEFSVWAKPIDSSYRIALPTNWDDYRSGLAKSPKRKMKKVESRLASGECTYHFRNDRDEIIAGLDELRRLHQLRRGTLSQPGCYADNRFQPFLKEAVDLLAGQGKAKLEWCEHQGRTIAMHILFLGTDTVYMYHSGVDPEFMHLEPGHLLTVAAIRNAIESGMRTYDFMRGEEPYKSYWGGQRVPLTTLRCYPPRYLSRLAGRTHEQLWNLKQSTKSTLSLLTDFLSTREK